MQKWEYMVVTVCEGENERTVQAVDGKNLQSLPIPGLHILIDNLVEEGWELTGSTDTSNCQNSDLFFKRAV
ncbi:hypothetical protein KTT_01640 [Tengunoibacter tsumagoiensis]|uniref:DUF4177 domain-containing protein n=2 Tax=Tengunoibacter tsumagoiensis TaxID=2014871 RepID=A0A401ZTU3_9CHLR|nr:hypothetical protein KTT_01640 [Tengunoibacter tsumagoiensis]